MTTNHKDINLVIFTCQGREHLLYNTLNSFKKACSYPFSKTILAIDGDIFRAVIDHTAPDVIIQSPKRKGYVNNIIQTLPSINSEYFFWLEDDWTFNDIINIPKLITPLNKHNKWVQIVYSKTGPLSPDLKTDPLLPELYKNVYGFSANPCLCRSSYIKTAFNELVEAPKGNKLGEDGFENFLTRYFEKNGLPCVIHDPVDKQVISHAGYLESTPRNWHMTDSITQQTNTRFLTPNEPPLWRRGLMAFKILRVLPFLIIKQFTNNEVYDFCFRIIASVKTINKK